MLDFGNHIETLGILPAIAPGVRCRASKASASSVARTILSTPGKDARISTSLLSLPRLGLFDRDETGGQRAQLMIRLPELPVHEADTRDKRSDVGNGGFGRTGGHLNGRFAQDIEHMTASKRRIR
ncbi:hypothetical protein [Bradyrhizobium tropiciagri]|uniref:hypothetical protein n=1 Tax=Bradyrhizobium tropiciagri TaxID=312253 RepID=UPI00067B9504|nr:hypothetical protein [Bradyrhizobium tropiciagri]